MTLPATQGLSDGELHAIIENGVRRQAIENGVSQVDTTTPTNSAGRFPQVANLTFAFDATQPAGSRVTSLVYTGPAAGDVAQGSPIDDAVQVEDSEVVRTTYSLLREEGLFLGSTSGVNVAAAIRVARDLGPGHTVVTVLCDGGSKYLSRFYNPEWLAAKGLAEYMDAGLA